MKRSNEASDIILLMSAHIEIMLYDSQEHLKIIKELTEELREIYRIAKRENHEKTADIATAGIIAKDVCEKIGNDNSDYLDMFNKLADMYEILTI